MIEANAAADTSHTTIACNFTGIHIKRRGERNIHSPLVCYFYIYDCVYYNENALTRFSRIRIYYTIYLVEINSVCAKIKSIIEK